MGKVASRKTRWVIAMRRAGTTRGRMVWPALILAIVVVAVAYAALSTGSKGPAGTTSTGLASSSSESFSSSTQPSTSLSSSTTSSSQPRSTSSAAGHISHVILILMENEEYGSVIGSPDAPYQNGLASKYALAADYFGVAHPSLPNYLALVAGSTFGVSSDCLPAQCSFPSGVPTIAALLDSRGLTWREYAESMQANCSQTNSPDGMYFTKHNPLVYFGSITGNNGTGPASNYCDSHVVPIDQFYSDLQAGDVPNFSFITPNICDDAHSCPLSVGDSWLQGLIPKITGSSSFPSTAVFIVYDEGATNDTAGGGGQVPCILVSPFAKPGYLSNVNYDHYSLLATVEEIFKLGDLGRNDTAATPMNDMFVGGSP